MCTAKAVREYFQTGGLPSPDTICETDIKPLLGPVGSTSRTEMIDADERLMDVLRRAVRDFMG